MIIINLAWKIHKSSHSVNIQMFSFWPRVICKVTQRDTAQFCSNLSEISKFVMKNHTLIKVYGPLESIVFLILCREDLLETKLQDNQQFIKLFSNLK